MIKAYIINAEPVELSEENLSRVPALRREKIKRLRFERDKKLSLAAGLAITELFGDRELSFSDFGKPFIEGGSEFNLAHSGKLVALAVDGTEPVGCDIERMRPLDPLRVGRIVFCENEMDKLRSARDKCDMFFTLWTKKEAFIKCIGEGFHFASKKIDISSPDNTVSYNGKTYFFKEYMRDDYKIMICSTENSFADEPVLMN